MLPAPYTSSHTLHQILQQHYYTTKNDYLSHTAPMKQGGGTSHCELCVCACVLVHVCMCVHAFALPPTHFSAYLNLEMGPNSWKTGYPACLHTTSASKMEKPNPQRVPHSPSTYTSALLMCPPGGSNWMSASASSVKVHSSCWFALI